MTTFVMFTLFEEYTEKDPRPVVINIDQITGIFPKRELGKSRIHVSSGGYFDVTEDFDTVLVKIGARK